VSDLPQILRPDLNFSVVFQPLRVRNPMDPIELSLNAENAPEEADDRQELKFSPADAARIQEGP
jgi:hypothetical protein